MTSGFAHDRVGTLDLGLEQHRAELTAYCRHMVSSSEAEDAVQETLVRAWSGFDRFEGRASLRTWLYRIATNVCLTMRDARQRRAVPIEVVPSTTDGHAGATHTTWAITPGAAGTTLPSDDPAEISISRERIRFAFVTTVRHLPPRQRAVLILREVLRWKAHEVAELLDTSVASVNSALQRARLTLAARDLAVGEVPQSGALEPRYSRYVEAFERYDVESLTSLLCEDARRPA